MATLDKEQPSAESDICMWCRAALHKKCEKHKLHSICLCNCEAGY